MKKTYKIIGIVILVSFIVFIVGFVLSVYFTLSGIGNPITRIKAKNTITEYVEENYPNNDFEDFKVTYNFKFGVYGAQMVSKSSDDTRFYVSYDDGQIEDSFDNYVTKGLNTYSRLSKEFDDYITQLLDDRFPSEIELCIYDLFSSNSKQDVTEIIVANVPLDGTLDIKLLDELGIKPDLTVWFITEEITYDYIAEKFIEVKALMELNDIYASTYSLRLKLPEEHKDRFEKGIHVYDFPSELIGSDEFIDKIIEFDEKGKQTVKVD